MLERTSGPFFPQKGLVIEFDQQPARIQAATRGEFSQRRRAADLPSVAVDENA
jgi:hypothetical protein